MRDAMLGRLMHEAVLLEPGMRALVPWDTGNSRAFLWLSASFVIVVVAVAAAKCIGFALKGVTTFISPERSS